ncbi:MAG: hypothetical protein QNJ20_02525 [Paracoccaceae bacterium]|nr:hypothetical protein [Paracoccaceae bacterium]
MQSAERLMIETIGVPRVTDGNGDDVTPVGSRNRAILVILALSPRMTVGRRWLEALLWSDRNAEQASGSLRQALSSIRSRLGGAKDLLCASRTDVWLRSDAVTVDLIDAPGDVLGRLKSGREFLEGIDIASEGFEDWLRQERAWLHDKVDTALLDRAESDSAKLGMVGPGTPRLAAEPGVSVREALDLPILYLAANSGVSPDSLAQFLTDTISAQLTQTATCHFRADVRAADGTFRPKIISPGAHFVIRVTKVNDEYAALARMLEQPTGKVFWSRQIFIDIQDNQAMIDVAASLATEASEAMAARRIVASSAQTANAMAAEALGDVFSFDPDRLRSAISTLAHANDLDPHAPRPALRALALAFLALETRTEDTEELRAEAAELIRQSQALDAGNALALSFLADVQDLVFEDSQTALSYAKCALHSNPGIGYAYASLGALELRRGDAQAALSAANRAQRQLVNSSLEVFSLMRLCVANMTTLNFEAAERAAQRAAELAPTSQPPLRHLYALRLRSKDEAGAREALTALRRLDPTFSMRFLRENPYFPAATLRSLHLHKLKDVDL